MGYVLLVDLIFLFLHSANGEFINIPEEVVSIKPTELLVQEDKFAHMKAGTVWNTTTPERAHFRSVIQLYSVDASEALLLWAEFIWFPDDDRQAKYSNNQTQEEIQYFVTADENYFGVAHFTVKGLSVVNAPSGFILKREMQSPKSLTSTFDEEIVPLHVLGPAQCDVQAEGQDHPIADGETHNTLLCDVRYSSGSSALPESYVVARWPDLSANTGSHISLGSQLLLRNRQDVSLDPAEFEGSTLRCEKVIIEHNTSVVSSCETPVVHSPPRNVKVSKMSDGSSFYPSYGALKLDCSADGFPLPSITWQATGGLNAAGGSWTPDLSLLEAGNATFTCFAKNAAGGKLKQSSASIEVFIEKTTTSSTTSSTTSLTTSSTPSSTRYRPRQLTSRTESDQVTSILIGVFVTLAVLVIAIIPVVCYYKRAQKKESSNEISSPNMIVFDNVTPSPNIKPLPSDVRGVDFDEEGLNEIQFDNRPGSRRPIASPLETTESLMDQSSTSPSLSPFHSMHKGTVDLPHHQNTPSHPLGNLYHSLPRRSIGHMSSPPRLSNEESRGLEDSQIISGSTFPRQSKAALQNLDISLDLNLQPSYRY